MQNNQGNNYIQKKMDTIKEQTQEHDTSLANPTRPALFAFHYLSHKNRDRMDKLFDIEIIHNDRIRWYFAEDFNHLLRMSLDADANSLVFYGFCEIIQEENDDTKTPQADAAEPDDIVRLDARFVDEFSELAETKMDFMYSRDSITIDYTDDMIVDDAMEHPDFDNAETADDHGNDYCCSVFSCEIPTTVAFIFEDSCNEENDEDDIVADDHS